MRLRYFILIGVITIGFMTIVASGSGGNGDSGTTYPDTVIQTISVEDLPHDIAITSDGNYVYVTNIDEDTFDGTVDGTVSVIQTSDNTLIQTIS